VSVPDARRAAGGHGGDEALFDSGRPLSRLEVIDVCLEQLLPHVTDRPGRHREPRHHPAARIDTGCRIFVRGAELIPVAPLLECGETDIARAGRVLRWIVDAARQLQTAESLERVEPPRAVVDGRARPVAVLAVVRDIDADLFLATYDLLDGGRQALQHSAQLDAFARKPRPVQLYEIVWSRQAARVGGQDAFRAAPHKVPP
jgi:hypothetical protein